MDFSLRGREALLSFATMKTDQTGRVQGWKREIRTWQDTKTPETRQTLMEIKETKM
jgi:hypothetical protein